MQCEESTEWKEKSIYEVGRNSPLGPLDPLPSPKGWAAVPTSCCGIVRSSSGDNTKRRVCSPTVAAPSAVRVRRWQLTCPSATDRPAGHGRPMDRRGQRSIAILRRLDQGWRPPRVCAGGRQGDRSLARIERRRARACASRARPPSLGWHAGRLPSCAAGRRAPDVPAQKATRSCGTSSRAHIGTQLRCCDPRGAMSCGSPMPRGERIANRLSGGTHPVGFLSL